MEARRRVIVKFHDHVTLPYDATVAAAIESRGVGPLSRLVSEFGPVTIGPVIQSKTPDQIRELVNRAVARTPSYRPANFFSYFAVTPSLNVNVTLLAKTLMAWPTVEVAYPEPVALEPPAVNPSDDPRNTHQGYLDAAPDGIDARYAWLFDGGDGAGQAIVDLEQGWNVNHEDLSAHGITMISGASYQYFRHGTRALGVMTASDNVVGGVGIAPNVQSVRCVGQFLADGTPVPIPQAIADAIAVMSAGDVLLLEAQSDMWGYPELPVEADPDVFAQIQLAIASGIVVVEAAGNGGTEGVDLDTVLDFNGVPVFDRNLRDSGAIIVGACLPHQFRKRLVPSCFGSRVDCYGWGQGVDTTSTDDTGTDNTAYTGYFSGTSSASAVVAGAALAVQGLAEEHLGGRLGPLEVRALLSDPSLGTPSEKPADDRIGPMPDLRAIIGRHGLNIAPDVYMRDFVGDVGDPHTDVISASPDVILRQISVADPALSFGEGSGTENDVTLGDIAREKQDNYIYVRVRNRGRSEARNVDITVYYAAPTTLLTPDVWTLVGTTRILRVPAGDLLTVSDELVWPGPDVPATGHYCFIALVGHSTHVAPTPANFLLWDDFCDYIRTHSDVTWRNFNVVQNVPPPGVSPAAYVEMPFSMGGAPDRARAMQLEVVGRLPPGAEVRLEMPQDIAWLMRARSVPVAPVDRRELVQVAINPAGRTALNPAPLPTGARVPMRLLARIPEKFRQYQFEICARQLHEGKEVGRVTWRLVPPR